MNLRPSLGALLAIFLAAGFAAPASAQTKDQGGKKNPKATKQDAGPQQDDSKTQDTQKSDDQSKADQQSADYAKAVKDLTKTTGAFTFYTRKKDILLELPESNLNKVFLIQAAMDTGITSILMQAGDPIGDNEIDAYRFERHDDQVYLVRPNIRFRWDPNDMFNVAAQRSLPAAILGSFHIEQEDPKNHLILFNVSNLFYGEPFRINEAVNAMLGGQYGLDREKSGVDSIKSFQDNTVIRTHLHYFSPRGAEGTSVADLLGISNSNQLEDDRSAPMQVSYNMWYRKDDGYVPRLADGRVGYFTEDFYSLNKFFDPDRTERYIFRFNLKKKDPTEPLSPPVKPIVWVIDPSVPEKYRDAVKEGILRWNRAFEELGYKDAIQVQDQPQDKDYDHADGRYNVVRWTMSPDAGYAVALGRVDPFTGEVMNASVTVDANMLAYILNDYDDSTSAIANAHEKAAKVLLRTPDMKMPDDQYLWSTQKEVAMNGLEQRLGKLGWSSYACEEPEGLAASASFALSTLQTLGIPVDKEAYAKQYIADTVCHEIGHTLGLRHNFAGSTYLSTDQLADDDLTAKDNVSSSVMDYVPVNMVAVLKGKKNYFGTTVGPYDRWAIAYGYTDFGANNPGAETSDLQKIASKAGSPGLVYETDEDADDWNPFAVRFDNAADPLDYSKDNLEAAKRLRNYAVDFLPKPGQSYDERTRLIVTSILRTFREGRFSARFVGGLVGARSYKGDAVERPTLAPVDPKLQRQAMSLIVNNCFSPDAFSLPTNVLESFSFDPTNPDSSQWNAPLRDLISSYQMMLYATLMSGNTTDRIAENSYKWGNRKDAYTMDEHFGLMLGAVFKELGTNKPIPPLRRDLQRFAVYALTVQAGAPDGQISDDARVVAEDSLTRLAKRMADAQKQPGLDNMTRTYLRDTQATITRFLNRQDAVK